MLGLCIRQHSMLMIWDLELAGSVNCQISMRFLKEGLDRALEHCSWDARFFPISKVMVRTSKDHEWSILIEKCQARLHWDLSTLLVSVQMADQSYREMQFLQTRNRYITYKFPVSSRSSCVVWYLFIDVDFVPGNAAQVSPPAHAPHNNSTSAPASQGRLQGFVFMLPSYSPS